MYNLSIKSLKPGMVLYDDVFSATGEYIFKANTTLSPEKIELLLEKEIDEVTLSEPDEVNMTHYNYLNKSPHFKNFCNVYSECLNKFEKIMHCLDTGLDLNITSLITIRDKIFKSVNSGEQLIDYLYNLMSSETQITYSHCFNCGLLCYVFAKWCGFSDDELDTITISGFLFDIGKIKVDDNLLWKPDKLTPEEFIQIQHHIHLGYELVKNRTLPPHVITVMIMHHERCDGSGYPAGLKEDRIDPYALIASVADTYEAMTHPRAQRTALTPFQAIRVFEDQGLSKYGEKNTKIILKRIADMYIDRRVCLSTQAVGRIAEINDDALSRPVVYFNNVLYDLRNYPKLEIIRLE